MFKKEKWETIDLSFGYHVMAEMNSYFQTNYYVVVEDIFLLNMLTTLVKVKHEKLFEFIYLFDVWVRVTTNYKLVNQTNEF